MGWLTEASVAKIPGLAGASADAIVKARQHAVLQANHQKLQKVIESGTPATALIDPSDMTSQPYLAAEPPDMATSTHTAEIPRRLKRTVPVPAKLSTKSIEDTIAVASARLRFELGAHYMRQIRERVSMRYAGRV